MSALSPSQQPTVLFSIYQNNTWTIRRLVDETNDPATQRIILKIVGFLISCPLLLAGSGCVATYTMSVLFNVYSNSK